ncbi:MAG TPA: TM2 domain-containing protein [Candidatus Acidoferrales bacterium]|nr:TM2 domain-containing protein [Candidatus Acidoferrales bacterium]
MTPYAQMLAVQLRPEAQPTYAYEYHRYSKDPTLAFVLTLLLGIVGGESYYLGNYVRGVLMSFALLSGVGLIVTIPLWIVRCFTIQNECEGYNDYVAYLLALRYWPQRTESTEQPPAPPESPMPTTRTRPNVGGLPMTVVRR